MQPGGAKPGRRQVALVPGARVAVMTLDLPQGVQGAAREKVARRQVADMTGLADGALDIRPFHRGGAARGWTRVLVADATEMAGWRAAAGARCRAVLPDYLGLPVAERVWTIARDAKADQVIARLGPEDGFAAPSELAAVMLDQVWQELDPGARPEVILFLNHGVDGISDWADSVDLPVLRDPADLSKRKLGPLRILGNGELSFDLRRDAQAARARLRARVLPWRWPVLIGLIAAGLWAAGQILATQRMEEQRREMMAATTTLVRQHFVPDGPILDIRTQVSRALAARQRGGAGEVGLSGPLELFGQAAEVFFEQGAGIGVVSYGSSQGLEITSKVGDFSALDRLVEGLDQAGLRVEVAQSGTVQGGIEARLRLRSGEGAGGSGSEEGSQ